MAKFSNKQFYNDIASEIGCFSQVNFTTVDESKFNYFKELNRLCGGNSVVLDIGTGCGTNILKNLQNFKQLIGIDSSYKMIERANDNLIDYPIKRYKTNFMIMDGTKSLFFPDNYFNVVCSRQAPTNLTEIYRVLKPNGYFITEQIDEDDCLELKELFGRGQGYNVQGKQIKSLKKQCENNCFYSIKTYEIEQTEYYNTEDDLYFLLTHTPIITDFGEEKTDNQLFDEYVKAHTKSKGIVLNRKLFGIIAQK